MHIIDNGASNIVVRNIRRCIRDGLFESDEELIASIDLSLNTILESKKELLDLYRQGKTCRHKFKRPTFTLQRRFIGYVKVHTHQCSVCTFRENHTQSDVTDPLPGWAAGVTEQYYNNNI